MEMTKSKIKGAVTQVHFCFFYMLLQLFFSEKIFTPQIAYVNTVWANALIKYSTVINFSIVNDSILVVELNANLLSSTKQVKNL